MYTWWKFKAGVTAFAIHSLVGAIGTLGSDCLKARMLRPAILSRDAAGLVQLDDAGLQTAEPLLTKPAAGNWRIVSYGRVLWQNV